MYRCESCGGTFESFVTPGQCPRCGVWATVTCGNCRHTGPATEFIARGSRCPICNAEVGVPGAGAPTKIGAKDLVTGVGCLLLLTSCWLPFTIGEEIRHGMWTLVLVEIVVAGGAIAALYWGLKGRVAATRPAASSGAVADAPSAPTPVMAPAPAPFPPAAPVPVLDLRSDAQLRIEARVRTPLDEEDEALAHQLVDLERQAAAAFDHSAPDGGERYVALDAQIRGIGERLGANGGDDRMQLVAARVGALGGRVRTLEWAWNGICGWMA